jgi:hypothetical protein
LKLPADATGILGTGILLTIVAVLVHQHERIAQNLSHNSPLVKQIVALALQF